jgi:glutathione S-transferase
MKNINLTEHTARRLVDSLFAANAAQRGEICEWPVIGGHYVSGFDPIKAMKELAVRALVARDWFARNGPPDAPPLPLGYHEREDLKGGRGLLAYILALFARSLEGRNYNVEEHPPLAEYVSGVLWEAERVGGDIGTLPKYPDELAKLKKRYPPAMLAGIGPGFRWEPPKLHAQTMASYRRYRTRAASLRRHGASHHGVA